MLEFIQLVESGGYLPPVAPPTPLGEDPTRGYREWLAAKRPPSTQAPPVVVPVVDPEQTAAVKAYDEWRARKRPGVSPS